MEAAPIVIPKHWFSTLLSNRDFIDITCQLNADKSFAAQFTLTPKVEGPKGHSHGGFLATIMDEMMGGVCWYNGLPVLAAKLSVRYRKSVPLAGNYTCAAKIDRLETKRAMVAARIYQDDTTFCEATGVFVRVPVEFLRNEPDMARLVTIVDSLRAGRSLDELIALDRKKSGTFSVTTAENSASSSPMNWAMLAKRTQTWLTATRSLAEDALRLLISPSR